MLARLLCCLGTDLLYVVLVVKISASPSLLREPILGSGALEPSGMQTSKQFFMYSAASLILGSGRVLPLTDYGIWDVSFIAFSFYLHSCL
jgi:hypothetical protein